MRSRRISRKGTRKGSRKATRTRKGSRKATRLPEFMKSFMTKKESTLVDKACGSKPGFFSSKENKELYDLCSKLSDEQLSKVIANCLYGAKVGSSGYKLCLSAIGKGKYGVRDQVGFATLSTD